MHEGSPPLLFWMEMKHLAFSARKINDAICWYILFQLDIYVKLFKKAHQLLKKINKVGGKNEKKPTKEAWQNCDLYILPV